MKEVVRFFNNMMLWTLYSMLLIPFIGMLVPSLPKHEYLDYSLMFGCLAGQLFHIKAIIKDLK